MPNVIQTKTILNKTKRRDPWFLDDYTINPYSGCSYNCLFCYTRGSKYGINLEEKLSIKINAVELLDKQLSLHARKGRYGIIVLSSATDPYLQFEKNEKLTRRLLEVILTHRFPVHVITRSDLVLRDIDLLKAIAERAILPNDIANKVPASVFVSFSFSHLSDEVARIFEPGACKPSLRLEAHKEILKAGLYSGISLMPLLPWISDTGENLENIFRTFSEIGSKYVMPASITLHGKGIADSKTLVMRAIEKNYPHLLEKYRSYFEHSDSMPIHYTNALHKKLKSLGEQYQIPDRIAQL
jgi:DNA repair photolyase